MAKICYKVSILDIRWDPRSPYTTDTIILFFQMAILRTKLLPQLPVQWSSFPKYPHKVTWSKSSILVVAVAVDPGSFKFAWEKGLQKTLRILTARTYLSAKLGMKLFPILKRP